MSAPSKRLVDVSRAATDLRDARTEARLRIERLVRVEVQEKELLFEQAVLRAVETESVTNIARAISSPGAVPNRARIYAVLKKHKVQGKRDALHYPIVWSPREIATFDGAFTVYDAVGRFENFGPDKITGTFSWTYDESGLTQIYDPEGEPYPSTPQYLKILSSWLDSNPYPGDVI